MKGPAGGLALVLAGAGGGGGALLFLTPLWNEVRRGFFKLTGVLIVVLSAAMWAGVAAAREGGSVAGRWSLWLSIAFTAATALWLVLLFLRLHGPARVLGIASVPLSVGLLAAVAGASDGSGGVSFLQLSPGPA